MISEKQAKRFCKDYTKIENYDKAINIFNLLKLSIKDEECSKNKIKKVA